MAEKNQIELAERMKAQGGQVVYEANLGDLESRAIIDSDLIVYKVGEEIKFPTSIDFEAGQLQYRAFGDNKAYYLVLPNKVVYLSTFTKSVQPYDKELNIPKDEAPVTADNEFYHKVTKLGNFKLLLEYLLGKTLKVTDIKKVRGARWGQDRSIVGTKMYQVPVFVEVSSETTSENK